MNKTNNRVAGLEPYLKLLIIHKLMNLKNARRYRERIKCLHVSAQNIQIKLSEAIQLLKIKF